MTMRKRTWVLLIAVLFSLGACTSGDDDPDNGGTSGAPSAGTSGGGSGTGEAGGGSGGEAGGEAGGGGAGSGGLCIVRDEINPGCPQVMPQTGDCAPRGECCHRSSNIAKEESLGPDEPLELEYRVNFSVTANHPLTIGVEFLSEAATTRYNNEQQSTMWRFTLPRMDGQQVSGAGMAQIGVGRYNCDGTYSYYSDTAAPARAGVTEDVTRWIAEEVPVTVDASVTNADRIKIGFADNANRGLTWTPFLDNTTYALDWELIHQGFEITEIDITGDGRDCIGARADGAWTAGGKFIIYTPIKENDAQVISLIQQSYCALVAFGILPDGSKELSCLEETRCVPDGGAFADGGCDWQKLPDSLCPETDAEKALYGCHLGDEMNVNMEAGYPSAQEINCTQEAPTAAPDPAGSPGQCCDPMGESATLPVCNAYRLVQEFVAAAAEITDDERDSVQPNCLMP